MSRVIPLLLTVVLQSSHAAAQAPAGAQADSTFYLVSYIEVKPSSRSTALTTLRQYRDASRMENGNIRLEVFEQAERSGHFAIVETWRSAAAFDARAAAPKRLADAMQPMRVSEWDQRPYKTLSVASGPAEAGGRAVALITHVDVSPGSEVANTLKILAEASRLEKGNLRFDVLQHTMRTNHFTVIEIWQNQTALETHAAAAHTRQYRNDLQPLLGSPLDERVFKAIE